jgi:hypothetical protein
MAWCLFKHRDIFIFTFTFTGMCVNTNQCICGGRYVTSSQHQFTICFLTSSPCKEHEVSMQRTTFVMSSWSEREPAKLVQ